MCWIQHKFVFGLFKNKHTNTTFSVCEGLLKWLPRAVSWQSKKSRNQHLALTLLHILGCKMDRWGWEGLGGWSQGSFLIPLCLLGMDAHLTCLSLYRAMSLFLLQIAMNWAPRLKQALLYIPILKAPHYTKERHI